MRLTVIIAALALHGCAYHRVVVAVPNPPDQTYHQVQSSALGWGAVERNSVARNCPTNLLSEVRVKTSLVQALGTVLTLGLWQPATIEYRCSKLPTQEIEP